MCGTAQSRPSCCKQGSRSSNSIKRVGNGSNLTIRKSPEEEQEEPDKSITERQKLGYEDAGGLTKRDTYIKEPTTAMMATSLIKKPLKLESSDIGSMSSSKNIQGGLGGDGVLFPTDLVSKVIKKKRKRKIFMDQLLEIRRVFDIIEAQISPECLVFSDHKNPIFPSKFFELKTQLEQGRYDYKITKKKDRKSDKNGIKSPTAPPNSEQDELHNFDIVSNGGSELPQHLQKTPQNKTSSTKKRPNSRLQNQPASPGSSIPKNQRPKKRKKTAPLGPQLFIDNEFWPNRKHLFGATRTIIIRNDDKSRKKTDKELEVKEQNRLKKFKRYRYMRLRETYPHPFKPVLFHSSLRGGLITRNSDNGQNGKKLINSTVQPSTEVPSGPRGLRTQVRVSKNGSKSTKIYTSPIEAIQGNLSNCYLISSLSALGAYPELLQRLLLGSIPNLGLHSVCLCVSGKWVEITLDDYLPCSRSQRTDFAEVPDQYKSKLRLCHPSESYREKFLDWWNEQAKTSSKLSPEAPEHAVNQSPFLEVPVWAVLLEKAYSKIFGAFWNIGGGGGSVRALKDLTGAPVSFHFFDRMKKSEIWGLLKNSEKQGKPMAAPTHQDTKKMGYLRHVLSNWHSYTVLGVFEFFENDETDDSAQKKAANPMKRHKIVKVRDPWGKVTWPAAEKLQDLKIKQKVENFKFFMERCRQEELKAKGINSFAVHDDGVLYLKLSEFIQNFSEISICHYNKNWVLTQRTLLYDDLNHPIECKTRKKVVKNSKNGKIEVETYNSFTAIDNLFSQIGAAYQLVFDHTGEYYISYSQPDRRFSHIPDHFYISLVLVRFDSSDKNKPVVMYKGGFASNIRDPFFKVQVKYSGAFILFVKTPKAYGMVSGEGTIGVYGPGPCLVAPVVLKNHENGNPENGLIYESTYFKQREMGVERLSEIIRSAFYLGIKHKILMEVGLFRRDSGLELKKKYHFKPTGAKKYKWHSFDNDFTNVKYTLTGAGDGYGCAVFWNRGDGGRKGKRDEGRSDMAVVEEKSRLQVKLNLDGENISIVHPPAEDGAAEGSCYRLLVIEEGDVGICIYSVLDSYSKTRLTHKVCFI